MIHADTHKAVACTDGALRPRGRGGGALSTSCCCAAPPACVAAHILTCQAAAAGAALLLCVFGCGCAWLWPAGGQPYSIIGILDAMQSIKPDIQTVGLGCCYSYSSLVLVRTRGAGKGGEAGGGVGGEGAGAGLVPVGGRGSPMGRLPGRGFSVGGGLQAPGVRVDWFAVTCGTALGACARADLVLRVRVTTPLRAAGGRHQGQAVRHEEHAYHDDSADG